LVGGWLDGGSDDGGSLSAGSFDCGWVLGSEDDSAGRSDWSAVIGAATVAAVATGVDPVAGSDAGGVWLGVGSGSGLAGFGFGVGSGFVVPVGFGLGLGFGVGCGETADGFVFRAGSLTGTERDAS
jgi:hypothetical protein